MEKITSIIGKVCIAILALIGIGYLTGCFVYGTHRNVIWFVTDSMYFVRDFFPK